jgi:hypothetical protein
MNDYDKVGRYLVKRQPSDCFRWLLASPELAFHAWIDPRRVALPDQKKALKAITDVGQLESLAKRLLRVRSWAELLPNGE